MMDAAQKLLAFPTTTETNTIFIGRDIGEMKVSDYYGKQSEVHLRKILRHVRIIGFIVATAGGLFIGLTIAWLLP